jgi:hypothetical protein
LTAICAAYTTPPFLPFLAARRPGGYLDLDRRIDFPAIRFAVVVGIKIHD